MNLQQVKEALNKVRFSEESLKAMNEILDEAIKNGYITNEGKEKLLGIIDVEIEIANIEADAMEELALALESFAAEIDMAIDKAAQDLESIEKRLQEDKKEVTVKPSASE